MEMTDVIFTYLIKILAVLFATSATYLITKIKAYLSSKLDAEKLLELEKLIAIFVAAAEQQFKAEDPDGTGRKAYVEKQLIELGYVLSEEINSMIESAVYNINRQNKKGTDK